MGYRTYIASLPKREYNLIKSMTKEELIEYKKVDKDQIEENYIGIGVYDFGKSLYEFGKYTDFNPPKKSMSTFFKKKDLNKYFTEDHDFCVVNKEFLAYLIEHYSQKVRDYYKDMLDPFIKSIDKFGIGDVSDFLNSMKTNWNSGDESYTFDFSLISEGEQTSIFKMFEHIKSMASEWGVYTYSDKIRPYKLDRDGVVSSCKFEYAVFELTYIYNTFDWKRNVMYFYGY